ncbi:MAG: UDP-N-acetylglucosamine 1-carboxyvinyltransferase, partial [Clostridia bacterium]|nr:UDP-N-acetylglucosamine 1-carboxyvinyltransferase [Clostridia bacterium]
TDLQSQTAAVMSVANGSGVLTETVFPSRFGYASQLKTLGADITVKGNSAYINGVKSLAGGEVYAEDLRGGAGLTLACLKAEGRSVLHGVEHIDRGYDRFEEKLSALGLDIKRVKNQITREL